MTYHYAIAALDWEGNISQLSDDRAFCHVQYEVVDLHVDHLGSTRRITDDAGAVLSAHDYFPFGKEMSPVANDTSAKMFTGHERDAGTGLDYMLARYYSGGVARFISVDPGYDVDSKRSQSWNLYGYARNNPIAWIDPNGQATYLIVHGKPYTATDLSPKEARHVGGLFRQAALTRAREVQAISWFSRDRDRVEIVEVGTGSEFVQAVNSGYPGGPLASLDVLSHAWPGGLNFGEGPYGDEGKLFRKEDVDLLDPSLADFASCRLYGCQTALGQDNIAESIAKRLGIEVSGYDSTTHFDNTNPTDDNPDVNLVPDRGGRSITFSGRVSSSTSPMPRGSRVTWYVNGVARPN